MEIKSCSCGVKGKRCPIHENTNNHPQPIVNQQDSKWTCECGIEREYTQGCTICRKTVGYRKADNLTKQKIEEWKEWVCVLADSDNPKDKVLLVAKIDVLLQSEREKTIREVYGLVSDNTDVMAIYLYAKNKGVELNSIKSLNK